MGKRLARIERKGGYSGGSSKKPVVVPSSAGASVNKPRSTSKAKRSR